MSTETTYKMKAFELAGVALKHAAWVNDYDQGATGEEGKQLFAKHKPVISEKEIEDIVVRTQQRCVASGIPQDKMDKIVAALRSNAQAPNATLETVQKQAEAEVADAIAEVAKERAEQAAEMSTSQAWGQLKKMMGDAHNAFKGMGKYTTEEQKKHEAELQEKIEAARKSGNEEEAIRLTKELAKFYKETGREAELKALEAGDTSGATHAQTVQKHGTNMEKKVKEIQNIVDAKSTASAKQLGALEQELEGQDSAKNKLTHGNSKEKEVKKADNPIKDISPDELGELMSLAAAQNNKPTKTKGIS